MVKGGSFQYGVGIHNLKESHGGIEVNLEGKSGCQGE